MTDTILVTGAAETVGSVPVGGLDDRNVPVRAGAHSMENGNRLRGDSVDAVELTFRESEAVEKVTSEAGRTVEAFVAGHADHAEAVR